MYYQALVYFKTVAEMQHYTHAANALYVTQPALSKAIRNLEIELGANLFKKDGRNVTLTKFGELFYEYVKRSTDEIDRGVAAVRHLVDVECNTIFITALFSMYAVYLPDKILWFRRRNPSCRFSLEYKYTTAILQDVLHARSELGICSNFDTAGEFKSLAKYTLYTEPVGLIVSKDHPFAKRGKIGVDDLRNERFIVYIKSSLGTNRLISDLCAARGFEPNIVAEAYNDYGVIGMVASGDGIAIIPTTGFLNINSVVLVELDVDFPLTRDINLVWRADKKLPAITAAFRDTLIGFSKQQKETFNTPLEYPAKAANREDSTNCKTETGPAQ